MGFPQDFSASQSFKMSSTMLSASLASVEAYDAFSLSRITIVARMLARIPPRTEVKPALFISQSLCNLYSVTKGQQALREFADNTRDRKGHLPPLYGIFPDYAAPIVRNHPAGRELMMARWGMPSPVFALKGKRSDPGVTNVRNVKSPNSRRWLGVESRCVVPFTSFSENEALPYGTHPPIWIAFNETQPFAFFAGIWTRWTYVPMIHEAELA